jgi:predicted DNA-binding transcriptional regulator AlpA
MQVANFDNAATAGSPGPTITAAEIAALLGIKPATFLRKRSQLQAAGFPRPLPLRLGTPVYSRSLVTTWITSNGEPALEIGADVDPVDAARKALEARIGRAA